MGSLPKYEREIEEVNFEVASSSQNISYIIDDERLAIAVKLLGVPSTKKGRRTLIGLTKEQAQTLAKELLGILDVYF